MWSGSIFRGYHICCKQLYLSCCLLPLTSMGWPAAKCVWFSVSLKAYCWPTAKKSCLAPLRRPGGLTLAYSAPLIKRLTLLISDCNSAYVHITNFEREAGGRLRVITQPDQYVKFHRVYKVHYRVGPHSKQYD